MRRGKGCLSFCRRLDQSCSCHPKAPIDLLGENGVSTFPQSFLIGSLPNLHVSKTGVKPQMSLNSLQCNAPLSTGKFLTDYNGKIMSPRLYIFIIDRIFVKLTSSRTGIRSHMSLNSGLIRPVIFGVICPFWLKKVINDIVQYIVFSVFIRTLWNLQITWAGRKSRKYACRIDFVHRIYFWVSF